MSRDASARPAPLLAPVDPQSGTLPAAEPVYGDWMDYSLRRDLAEADALTARQRAEAEAQDAADLTPPPEAPDAPSSWWLLPTAAGGLLGWFWLGPLVLDLALRLIAYLF